EWQAPTPGREYLAIQHRGHNKNDNVGKREAEQAGTLCEAGEKAAAAFRFRFERQQGCAGPLTAERDTLDNAQNDQWDNARRSKDCITRDQADADRSYAHKRDSHYQRRLAADPIAEMSKYQGAERSCEKRSGHSSKGEYGADERILRRKEH